MKTHDEIIQARQNEIFNEVQDMDNEILVLTSRLEFLKAKKRDRIAEHEMLQTVVDRGVIVQAANGRASRLHIEDALKRIFDNAGRPLRVGEILSQLEQFGYKWSNYASAYNRVISGMDILENAGKQGYYQLIRVR